MAEKGQSHKSVASYLSLGPNPVNQLDSLVTRAKEITEEEEQLLATGDYPSITSITSEDEFIIIEENDLDGEVAAVVSDEKEERSDDEQKPPQHEELTPTSHPLPLSSIQQRFLQDKVSARQSVCQKLEQQGFKAAFDFDRGEVNIDAQGSEGPNAALSLIEKSVMEMKIDFTEEELEKMAVATDFPDGEPVSPFPMLSSDQEILVVVDRVEGSLRIIGLADAVHEMRETLRRSQELLNRQTTSAVTQDEEQDRKFRSSHDPSTSQGSPDPIPQVDTRNQGLQDSTATITVHVRESTLDYLVEHRLDEISALAADGRGLVVEMTDGGILVKGPSTAVNDVVDKINVIAGQVRSDTFTLDAGVNMARFTEATVNAGQNHNVMIAYKQSSRTIANRRRVKSQAPPQGGAGDRPGSSRVQTGVRVSVVLRRIENQPADVLVNTTNKQLNLGEGRGVSNSLLRAAGPTIQQQLNTVYRHGMTHGDLAKSGPGTLTTCKTIYHAALPYFRGKGDAVELSKCYEFLASGVFKSLINASSEGHQTIAFPALGTGALEYPVKNVVQLMFKAIDRYNLDQRGGSIKEIFIAIAPETRLEVKQLFLAQNLSHQMKTRQLKAPEQRGKPFALKIFQHQSQGSSAISDYFKTEVGKSDQPNCEVRVQIGDTLLQVIQGDIKKFCDVTDTVMVPWVGEEINSPNNQLGLKCIDPNRDQWPCRTYVTELPRAKCTADSTTLHGKTLIHTYMEIATEKCISGAIKEGLEKAVAEDCKIITIPVPAEGVLAARPEISVAAIFSAINGSTSGMYVVTVVIAADNVFIDFVTKLAGMKKLEEPADVSTAEFVDTLWSVTYSAQAAHSQTRGAAFNAGVDAVMVVTSDSEQRNRDAAQEVANELNTPLYDVISSRRQ